MNESLIVLGIFVFLVLALFGQGAFEGQYRFTATGQLLARWKP